MYFFDNNSNNKNDPSSTHTSNDNNNSHNYNNSDNNNNHPLFSQSFDPSTLHSLDNSYSFVNFDSDAPPSSFLQDGPSSFGHDSLLAQDWEGMYGSAFGDTGQDHQGQMFLPLQQQQQPEAQPSYTHSFDLDGQHKQPSTTNSEFFLTLTEQEQQAILMSEPNFLRQQHLLQDNHVKMKMEKQDDTQQLQDANGDGGIPMRSNLSAMFDQSTTDKYSHSDLSSSVPAANDLLHASYQPVQQQQQGQQQNQQQSTPSTKPTSSTTKSRKEINRRSQQGSGGRNNRTNPIPINGGSSGSVSKQSSSVPNEIDHQRRFNELQARFRVNYARKPTGNSATASSTQHQPPPPPSLQQQQQQQRQQQTQVSSPSTTKGLSSSFSGNSTNGFGSYGRTDTSDGTAFGSSVPKSIEKINVDSSLGYSMDTEKITDRSNNHSGQHASSTTTPATPTMSVAIPNDTKKNQSSSGGGKQASSFPSRTMPIQIQRVHRANANQPMDAEQHQKRLDDQLVKANFDDITVSELKEMLRQRGKPATGKKAILLQRLVEERDIIKAVRGGKIAHRHSQPPLPSSSSSTTAIHPSSFENTSNAGVSPRPRSYQGSSPMFGHTTLPPNSPLLDSPSSVPNSSMFLSSSPGSVTVSLNRSIANMHIGSPPLSSQHVRRFSPYGTPGSPRLGSSSPKMQMQRQAYSSSVPSDYLSSSPSGGGMALPPSFNNFSGGNDGYSNNNNNNSSISPMSPGPPNSTRNMRLYHQNQTWNGRQKSYAPFTSSALATPDRDDDDDPFDVMAREQENVDMESGQEQQQQQQQQQESQGPVQSQPLYDSLYQLQQHQQYDEQRQRYGQDQQGQQQQHQQYQQTSDMDVEGVKEESMEWVHNSDQPLNGILQDLPEGVSTEQFMAWFATMNAGTNEFDQFNLNMDGIKTENIDISGMMTMDTNHINYSGGSSYGHQQQ